MALFGLKSFVVCGCVWLVDVVWAWLFVVCGCRWFAIVCCYLLFAVARGSWFLVGCGCVRFAVGGGCGCDCGWSVAVLSVWLFAVCGCWWCAVVRGLWLLVVCDCLWVGLFVACGWRWFAVCGLWWFVIVCGVRGCLWFVVVCCALCFCFFGGRSRLLVFWFVCWRALFVFPYKKTGTKEGSVVFENTRRRGPNSASPPLTVAPQLPHRGLSLSLFLINQFVVGWPRRARM